MFLVHVGVVEYGVRIEGGEGREVERSRVRGRWRRGTEVQRLGKDGGKVVVQGVGWKGKVTCVCRGAKRQRVEDDIRGLVIVL